MTLWMTVSATAARYMHLPFLYFDCRTQVAFMADFCDLSYLHACV